MQHAFSYQLPPPTARLEEKACNSLSAAWATLRAADDLSPDALAALGYIEFVFNGAVKQAGRDLRHYLPQRHKDAANDNVLKALDAIRAHIDRHGSFFYPLEETMDEGQLVREALASLQDGLDASLDKNMQTARIREALRFLVWKTGNRWTYVNFWNALTFKGGNGLWQNGHVALTEIRAEFQYLTLALAN